MKLHLVKTMALGFCFVALASSATAEQRLVGDPKPLQMPDGFLFSTNNYPVTLCGTVEATSKDPKTSSYALRNGSLVVWLRISSSIDSTLRMQLDSLSGIYPLSGADGCLHGLHLPTVEIDRTFFDVEAGAIAISPGGISVSN